MVGFVIPFKSKAKSKNWVLDCSLLTRTLQSVLNQTDSRFKCYVVYSDLPSDPLQHERIQWIQFPFPFFDQEKIIDAEKYNAFGKDKKSWEHLPFFFDQGKKSLFGAMAAKEGKCQYIMMLDADDLIWNKLVAYVNKHDPADNIGFYVDKGYLYAENGWWLIKVPEYMNLMCGSVNIVREDTIPVIDFSIPTYANYDFFAAHSYVRTRLQFSHGKTMKPLPFYSLIYVFHSTNELASKLSLRKLTLRNLAKRIVRGKFLNQSTKKQFGLYRLSA